MNSHLERLLNQLPSLTGNQPAQDCFAFEMNPRFEQRGFSFGYFYFYFWFSGSSPSSARGQMTPA
jgi:hypothetical protein